MSYFVTLLGNRVLELTPTAGAPTPTRVRFVLRPHPAADGARVVVQLERVSEHGAPWRPEMRDVLQRWCQTFLGCALAPGVPRTPRAAGDEAPTRAPVQGELGVTGQARYAEPGR